MAKKPATRATKGRTTAAETKPPEEGIGVAENEDRRILVAGIINENIAALTINALLKLEQKDPTEPILMVLDSYGGSVDSMFAIIDTMELVRCDVATLCLGKAMSAGAAILLSGAKGKRFITPHARVMLHQVSSFAYGKVDDLDNEIEEVKRMQELLVKLIQSKTKLKGKKLKEMLAKDSYLIAKDAVKFGVVDKIITRFPRKGLQGF